MTAHFDDVKQLGLSDRLIHFYSQFHQQLLPGRGGILIMKEIR